MYTVEPIRKINDVNKVKTALEKQSKRNQLLFILGINTGLRISDILKLKVSDVKNKKYIIIQEQKTKKIRKIIISNTIKISLRQFTEQKNSNEYLFKSRKGNNRPISRIQAYRIIHDACQKAEVKERIGTHTMRKTFGYHFYKQTKDIALLQNILNHSSPNVTLRYIGVNQDIIDNSLKQFML